MSFTLHDKFYSFQTKLGAGSQASNVQYLCDGKLYTVKITLPFRGQAGRSRFELDLQIMRQLHSLQQTYDLSVPIMVDSAILTVDMAFYHQLNHYTPFKFFNGPDLEGREGHPIGLIIHPFIAGVPLSTLTGMNGIITEAEIMTELVSDLINSLLPTIKVLHENHIVHRDIKLDNILRNPDNGKISLIDFGLSRIVPYSGRENGVVGSVNYIWPQILLRGSGSSDDYLISDLYALGVCCYRLCNNDSLPYDIEENQENIPSTFEVGQYTDDLRLALLPDRVRNTVRLLLLKPELGSSVILEAWQY